jgi:hypothetical protein
MNDRIRELAEQATEYAFKCAEGDSKINPKITSDQWLKVYQEKFAELIVKECAELFPNVYVSIETEHGHTPVIAANYIKEHFGVEE